MCEIWPAGQRGRAGRHVAAILKGGGSLGVRKQDGEETISQSSAEGRDMLEGI